MVKVGIIGGSGLDKEGFFQDLKSKEVNTIYGKPSSELLIGKVNGVDVVFLYRHGKGHKIMPTNVNFRANIQALKDEGVTHIIAPTACGSLRKNIEPQHLFFPNQFIDWTKKREYTYFDKDKICHIAMDEPYCTKLNDLLQQSASTLKIPYHSGTVVTIEGPRFSTKAESHMFRMLGADIINMTSIPEVTLAREKGICYASIAMVTDYDCWHESEDPVTWDMILKTMEKNVENAKKMIFEVIPKIKDWDCRCVTDIKNALV